MPFEYVNVNPSGRPCPMCRPFLGMIFEYKEHGPPIPAHPHCFCLWMETDARPDWEWDWEEIDPESETYKGWVRYVAWLLREGYLILPFLAALVEAARRYNEEREEKKKDGNSVMEVNKLSARSGRILLGVDNGEVDGPRHEYACQFIGAGYVKQADQSESNWLIPASALEAAVIHFSGVPCRLDHPEQYGFGRYQAPKMSDVAGVTFNATWSDSDKAIVGGLRLYDHGPGEFLGLLLDQIFADQAQGSVVPTVAMSAVMFHDAEFDDDSGLWITRKITHVESVDVVYDAGAKGYIKSALSALQPGQWPGYSTEGGLIMPEGQVLEEQHDLQTLPAPAPAVTLAPVAALPDDNGGARIDALEVQMAALVAQSEQMLGLMTRGVEDDTVEGNGQEQRSGLAARAGRQSIDDFNNAISWMCGAVDYEDSNGQTQTVVLPEPRLRRLDNVYMELSGDHEWRGVFDSSRVYLATANASTLADMITDGMNKVIVSTYETLTRYRWFELVTSVEANDGTLNDMKWLTMGGIGALPEVPYGSAYTELTVGDSKEVDSYAVYGGYVGIDRKVLRNSDIARMQSIPRSLAIASIRQRSANIAGIFTSNAGVGPTLDDDSTALFHTNHSNLATTTFSYAAWDAARLELYKQTELTSDKRLGLWPYYWLGPADLYTNALDYFGYGAGTGGKPGTGDNDVNPFAINNLAGDPRPIPIAVPDFTDTNDWAYLADPAIHPVICMSYANSPGGGVHPPPQLFTVTSELAGLMFTNDTLPIKVRDEYAYGVATYRGIGKRNVT